MSHRALCVLLAAFAATMLPAAARADDTGNVGVGLQAGTIGIGPAVTYHLNNKVDLHLVSGLYTLSPTITSNSTTYSTNVHIGGTVAYADFRPNNGILRLSAGLFRNVTSLAVAANATGGTVQINNRTYSTAAIGGVNGTISLKGVSPFVGLGFGGAHFRPHSGVSIFAFGGVGLGSNVTTTLAPGNPNAYKNFPQLQADVQQAQADLQNKLNVLKVYPVTGIGLQVRI